MWDIYNEPGQFGVGEASQTLLRSVWAWAHEIRPCQPLTSCIHGAIGGVHHEINKKNSDVLTFHMYEAEQLEECIEELVALNRPVICTEYMARGHGTTFQFSLPIFKNTILAHKLGACRGKSQTHFDWHTIMSGLSAFSGGLFIG